MKRITKSEEKFKNEIVIEYNFSTKASLIYVRFHFIEKNCKLNEMLISTGVSCLSKDWNAAGGCVTGKGINVQAKNEKLDKIKGVVKDGLHELKKLKIQTLQILKDEIENGIKLQITNKAPKGQKQLYLSRLREHKLDAIRESYVLNRNFSEPYERRLKCSVNKFNDWYLKEYKDTPSVTDVTEYHLIHYKSYLQVKHKLNTESTELNKLKTLFKYALKKNIININPFPERFIKGYETGERNILTDEEILNIYNIPDDTLTKTLQRTKYTFLFMCATGMGYGELKAVRKEHIEEVDKQLFLKKKRVKTGVPFSVPFSPLATKVYHCFFNWLSHQTGIDTIDEPFANLPSADYTNRKLCEIMEMAGVNKPCTSYDGRHSFITNWIKDGGKIEVAADIVGHTDIKTTMVYVNLLPETLIEQANNVYQNSKFHSAFAEKL